MVNFYIDPNHVSHELPKNSKLRFFMFGVPTYTNMGDQAISFAARKYVEHEFPQYQYIEVVEDDDDEAIEYLKKHLKPTDIIAFTGGGNMGNLYVNHEIARRKVFASFLNNLTISFPQSIHFENNAEGNKQKLLSQKAYGLNKKLFLAARDAQSYHRMQSTFDNQVIFTPDMVLYLDPVKTKKIRSGALFVLRRDSEKVVDNQVIEQLKKRLKDGRTVSVTDTVLDDIKRITPINREKLLKRELELFSKQEIVVTDRWHAMVFSVLTGTPCLLMGNSYGKGKHAYFDWLENINWISYNDENDIDRIYHEIKILMKAKTHDYDLKPDFRQLYDLIKQNS